MRKNIYIKDGDQELFEWAENEAGVSLSSILAEALRQYRHKRETEAELEKQGFATLTVEVARPGSDYIQKKQFEGRWVISEFSSEDERYPGFYSVGFTKRGRIVVTHEDELINPTTDEFKHFDSLDHLKNGVSAQNGELLGDYPDDLISAIAAELGEEYIEVLDI